MKYEKSTPNSALRLGELLSNVIETMADANELSYAPTSFLEKAHPYAFVVSQDCDLDWDFADRTSAGESSRLIPNVLMCEVMTAKASARQIIELEGSKSTRRSRIWARVKANKDERFHFFEEIGEQDDLLSEKIGELVVDFKRFFTLPTDELYWRIDHGETKRRCRLVSPYLEHLSSRFAYFLSRVALPEDHLSVKDVVRRRDG